VSEAVDSACEILGFDPLYVANEGRFIVFVPESQTTKALQILQKFPEGEKASWIGSVKSKSLHPQALIQNPFGAKRPLYRLVGDQLPRIC
jgi:hydrogenase expression/formation protein HypE